MTWLTDDELTAGATHQEQQWAPDPPAERDSEGGPTSMMLARLDLSAQTPEPSTAEWRARCLLALALVNHRADGAGLGAVDVEAVRGALLGEWVA